MKKELEFALRYFVESEDRWIASLLVLGAAVSAIGFAGSIAWLSWWSVGFWAALTAMNLCAHHLKYCVIQLLKQLTDITFRRALA